MTEEIRDIPQVTQEQIIRQEVTDDRFPEHWRSGSLKYSDFKPLTQGGAALLKTCADNNLHRIVVYKTLHEDLRSSEIETARFLREARVTALISHPGTVPLYELGRDRTGALYFTMKKLEGRDLREIIDALTATHTETLQAFPLPKLVDTLIAASYTVAYAHKQGVIHRDLKPANILVGEFGETTVLDWGLAKVRGEIPLEDMKIFGKKGIALHLTQPGRRFGTPLYMSPEQARGDDNVDERTDVYNLGSILFEMLTLKNLIDGNDVEEVLQQVLERPTPSLRETAPGRDIPRELEAICLRALQHDPADRYQSVPDMIADLEAHRRGDPVTVCTYHLRDRLLQWERKHSLTVVALLGAIIGAAATALVMSIF